MPNSYVVFLCIIAALVIYIFFLLRKRKRAEGNNVPSSVIGQAGMIVSELPEAGQELIKLLRKSLTSDKIPLSSIFDISKGMISNMKIVDLMNLIVDVTMRIMDAEICSLMLLNNEKGELRIAAAKGLNEKIIEETVIKLGEGISGHVALTGHPLFIEDITKESKFKGTGNPVYRAKSLISVPLMSQDRVIGVLNVNSKIKGKFDEDDVYSLMVISAQAASSIENARMYREVSDRLKALEAILDISKTLLSSMDIDIVIQHIVEKASEIMSTPMCSVRLLDDAGENLRIKASTGLSNEYLDRVGPLKAGDSIAGRVLSEGRPISVYDTNNDQRYQFSGAAAKEGIVSILCVPIISKARVLGVLTSYTKTPQRFQDDEVNLFLTFAAECAVAIENARLYDDLNRSYFDTIQTLALAVEARDPYTRGHSERVTQYSVDIGKELGLSSEQIINIKYAGKLHDIGKIAVRDDILTKAGPLTPAERADIKLHPDKGAQIIEPLKFMKEISKYIRYHHERFDGKGYPDGIKEDKLPLIARILAVADSFDAMTSNRPYRSPMPVEAAIDELERGSGTQFDPDVVKVFKKLLMAKK